MTLYMYNIVVYNDSNSVLKNYHQSDECTVIQYVIEAVNTFKTIVSKMLKIEYWVYNIICGISLIYSQRGGKYRLK